MALLPEPVKLRQTSWKDSTWFNDSTRGNWQAIWQTSIQRELWILLRSTVDRQKRHPQENDMSDIPEKQIRWTIMLYIAADGNIANFAVESLKQLNYSASTPSGAADQAKVVVAAQFAIDAPGGQQIPRYIFNECSGGPLGNSLVGHLKAPDNMTEQQALISFLQWVYGHPKCEADKYALILWGHGPELLMQPPSAQQLDDSCAASQNGSYHLYLSPEELRVALEVGKPKDKRLKIIGFDACSMSMFEVAYEVRGLVDYMVASQEEVPDLSFPYDTLVDLFRKMGNGEERLLKEGVYAYVEAYQDYVCNAVTRMRRATLSALRLNRVKDLESALRCLACALHEAKDDPSLPALLIEAREGARDFVTGLYVDLVDFSAKLVSLLSVGESEYVLTSYDSRNGGAERSLPRQSESKRKIKAACKQIIKALAEDSVENPTNSLVLANCAADAMCHGVSLYFPYLRDQQYPEVGQPMVKGGPGTQGGKDFSMVLNHAGSGLLMCARRELIVDTESYYGDLAFAIDTGWYRFIVEQWSRILVESAPEELDILYSAQQCAVNACRGSVTVKLPCPIEETL
jgi:Clostripain family